MRVILSCGDNGTRSLETATGDREGGWGGSHASQAGREREGGRGERERAVVVQIQARRLRLCDVRACLLQASFS